MTAKDSFVPNCVKHAVYFMNFLFFVLGVFSMGMGVHVYFDQLRPIQDIFNNVTNPAVILIALGGMVFIAATIGCIGSKRENLDFLRAYILAIIFLLLVHIAMGVLSFMVFFSEKPLKEGNEAYILNGLSNYKEDKEVAQFMDTVQSKLQCCGAGIHGYQDWLSNPYYDCDASNNNLERCSVPASCCKPNPNEIDSQCGHGLTNSSLSLADVSPHIYTKGCIEKIVEVLHAGAVILGVLSFGIAVPLLCGILIVARMILVLQENVEDYYQTFQTKKHNFYSTMPINFLYQTKDLKKQNVNRLDL